MLAVGFDPRAAFGADDVPGHALDYRAVPQRTSRHERIRTPAGPTPLLKSSGSPNSETLGVVPPPAFGLPDVVKTRCWSTMNGAVARSPATVFATVLSVLLSFPSLFVSYAAPPL